MPTANYNKACDEGSVNGGGTVCQTDNASLYYYMISSGDLALESGDEQVVRSTLESDYEPTDFSVNYDSTPVFSGSGETDIIYQEGDVPGSDVGYTWCNDDSLAATYRCDQQYVQIQWGYYYHGLVCHESGHAVGLVHGEDSAPEVDNENPDIGCMAKHPTTNEQLGANQFLNINSVY